MNYSHDSEMDRDWAADQLRRKQNLGRNGLPDMPIRRATSALPQVAVAALRGGLDASTPPGDPTLGSALSALAINAQSADQVRRICDGLTALLSDRDRVALHKEFAQLKGVEAVLSILRKHGGEAALSALRVVEKLSRTLPRELCAAGGVDVLARCAEVPGQAPRLVEASLRCLHGLTFDTEAKPLVSRRGVQTLVESLLEEEASRNQYEIVCANEEQEAALREAWADAITMCKRLLQRLTDGRQPAAANRR